MLSQLRYHHVGIACRDIEKTRAFYLAMGYTAQPIIDDPLQDIRICFLEHPSQPMLELLAPIDEKSPVNRILKAVGVSPYHICYSVDDLEATMKSLRREHRFVTVSKPLPACAIDNRRVAFMFHNDVGLIELVETQASSDDAQ